MALELVAKLIRKLPEQSGTSARGEWKKQEFIAETQEVYPRKVCMSVWGADKVAELAQFSEGEMLKFSLNIESREYNGRWYTDVRAWRIERTDAAGSAPAAPAPAAPAPVAAPAVSGNDLADQEDDLPF